LQPHVNSLIGIKTTGTQRFTTLTCVQAGNENKRNETTLLRLQT